MYIVEVMQSVSLSRFFENPPIYWIFCKLERSFLKFTSAAVISLDGKRNSSFIQKMFKSLFFFKFACNVPKKFEGPVVFFLLSL